MIRTGVDLDWMIIRAEVDLDYFSEPGSVSPVFVASLSEPGSVKSILSHYNEWHYLNCGWDKLRPKDPRDYVKTRSFFDNTSGPEGAAFCAAVLMMLQDCRVDVANYYTGDTSRWGLFDEYGAPRKTYYAFRAFNELCKTPRRLSCASAGSAEPVAACAGLAADEAAAGILLSNPGPADAAVRIDLRNLPWKAVRVDAYRVDAVNDFALASTEALDAAQPALAVNLPKSTVCLVRLTRSA